MTDREKVEKLARWCGYDQIVRALTGPDPISDDALDRWWNPCKVRDDAMDLFEKLASRNLDPVLVSTSEDDWMLHFERDEQKNLMAVEEYGNTIPEAITTAVLAWLEER